MSHLSPDPRPGAPAAYDPAERPVFSAVLHPHRSLGLRGYRLVIVLVAAASMAASIPSWFSASGRSPASTASTSR